MAQASGDFQTFVKPAGALCDLDCKYCYYQDQVTADLNACVDYLKGLPSCNGKVSVVGFSWGGSRCFRLATNRKDLAAAFVFYGGGPDAAGIPRIQAPAYGFYGGSDARIGATVPPT